MCMGLEYRAAVLLCYMEKATPARHRPERQHNARSNRRKQCSPNETKPYSNPTTPRKRKTTVLFCVLHANLWLGFAVDSMSCDQVV